MGDVYTELNESNRKLCIAIKALEELSEPTGAYSMDRLTHAENTIQKVGDTAKEALEQIR